jgi:hypothetical protein
VDGAELPTRSGRIATGEVHPVEVMTVPATGS